MSPKCIVFPLRIDSILLEERSGYELKDQPIPCITDVFKYHYYRPYSIQDLPS